MQIEPMVANNFVLEPAVREPIQNVNQVTVQPFEPAPQSADPLQSLQSQFTSMMKELTKELSALEKRFSQVVRQFAKSCASLSKSAGAGTTTAPNASTPKHRYAGLIEQAAQRNQIDPALLTAVIRQESGFDPNALSKAGAMGLTQLMPGTAHSLGVQDPYDPRQNIEGGARLLRQLLDRYDGKVDWALAAYNAGAGAVDAYGGVPPYAETQAYVRDVTASYRAAALTTRST